jgi:hypothetical protein
MDQNTYKHGEWNVICDRCGSKYKASQLRREWTGYMVCHGPGTNDCWEEKHPQLDIRGVKDTQTVPWSRPEPTDVELDGTTEGECTAASMVPVAGEAVAGCAMVGYMPHFADDEAVPSSTFNISDTIGA